MRGLLVVNPNATATTARTRDVLVHALADQFHLETVETRHRGHATDLAQQARKDTMDCVITLGGDGTVNEVVNGLLIDGPGPDVPCLGTVPGGAANVFARALGLPADPVEATGYLVDALRNNRTRTVNIGHVDYVPAGEATPIGRYLTFNAGVGLDAEVIRRMEAARAKGKSASQTRYIATTLQSFFAAGSRKEPALTLTVPDGLPEERSGGTSDSAQDDLRSAADGNTTTPDVIDGVFLIIIQATSPWTYLGALPLNPLPKASFDKDLSIWAVRKMSVLAGLRYGRRIVMRSKAGSTKSGLVAANELRDFTVDARPPSPFQIDGEGLGEIQHAHFTSVPDALRVYV